MRPDAPAEMARGAGRALRRKERSILERQRPGSCWNQAGRVLGSKERMGGWVLRGRSCLLHFPFLSSPWDSSCIQGTQGSVCSADAEGKAGLSFKIAAWVERSFLLNPQIRLTLPGVWTPWVWSYPEWPEAPPALAPLLSLAWGILFWGWEVPEGGDTGVCSQMRHR